MTEAHLQLDLNVTPCDPIKQDLVFSGTDSQIDS